MTSPPRYITAGNFTLNKHKIGTTLRENLFLTTHPKEKKLLAEIMESVGLVTFESTDQYTEAL